MTDLTVDVNGYVGVVEIHRGPHNFFDVDLIEALADSIDHLASESVRAVVLCTEGKNFCAGANLRAGTDRPAGRNLYDEALRLFAQPLPLIAAVQGGAVGGGLGLAMAADFRVASSDAWFSANFSRLGFHHGFALSATLPACVGLQRSQELLFTGRRVSSDEALAMGLCDRVVEVAEVRPSAIQLATEIAEAAPLAVQAIRATLRKDLVESARSAVSHEVTEQRRLMATADFVEGVAATNERRTPRFEGR